MSDADAAPGPAAETAAANGSEAPKALPLFYGRPEVLEANRHAGLRLGPHDGYGFAAGATAIPLNVAEFARAATSYPIVFAGKESLSPVAVLGLRRGQNLFVDPATGAWEAEAYVPAYARRYPFILTRPDAERDQVMLCVDRACPRLSQEEGSPLFEDRQPSETARNALEFCLTFQRQAIASEQVTAALKAAGVLQAQEGTVELGAGETLRLTDFHVVDEAKLNALSDEAWLELRRVGAVAAAYCQLTSMNNWPALTRRAEARGKV